MTKQAGCKTTPAAGTDDSSGSAGAVGAASPPPGGGSAAAATGPNIPKKKQLKGQGARAPRLTTKKCTGTRNPPIQPRKQAKMSKTHGEMDNDDTSDEQTEKEKDDHPAFEQANEITQGEPQQATEEENTAAVFEQQLRKLDEDDAELMTTMTKRKQSKHAQGRASDETKNDKNSPDDSDAETTTVNNTDNDADPTGNRKDKECDEETSVTWLPPKVSKAVADEALANLKLKLKSLPVPHLVESLMALASDLAEIKHHRNCLQSIVSKLSQEDCVPTPMRDKDTLQSGDTYKNDPRTLQNDKRCESIKKTAQRLKKEVMIDQRKLEMEIDMENLRAKLLLGLCDFAIDFGMHAAVTNAASVASTTNLPERSDCTSTACIATQAAIRKLESQEANLLKSCANDVTLHQLSNMPENSIKDSTDKPALTQCEKICEKNPNCKIIADSVIKKLQEIIPLCTHRHQQAVDLLTAQKKSEAVMRAHRQGKLNRTAANKMSITLQKEKDALPDANSGFNAVMNKHWDARMKWHQTQMQ